MPSDRPTRSPLPQGIDSRNVLDLVPPPSLGEFTIVVRGWMDPKILPRSKIVVVQTYSTLIALTFTIPILLIHYMWAVHSQCSVNFQRAGADISLVAATIFAFMSWYAAPNSVLDSGGLPKFSWRNPNFALPVVALIGTMVWGYGDMLPGFGNSCSDPSPATQVQSLLETRLRAMNADSSR